MTKWLYLSPEAPNPKNKGTFFSLTLKVGENKVSLFFGFGASGLRYGHFLIFLVCLLVKAILKMTKWLYLSPEAPNPKNKGTFFSLAFKVGENKVSLFFVFGAPGLRYGQFLIFLVCLLVKAIIK